MVPFRTAAALEIPAQGRVHALRYLQGLAGQFLNSRGQLFSQVRAQPPQDGTPCIVSTANGELQATDVIVATHSAYLRISQFDMRQAAYQSYVLAVRVEEEIPDALFWDDAEPYHYLRIAASGDPRLLLIGRANAFAGSWPGWDPAPPM